MAGAEIGSFPDDMAANVTKGGQGFARYLRYPSGMYRVPCRASGMGATIASRNAEAGTPVATLISGLLLVSRPPGIRGELGKRLHV